MPAYPRLVGPVRHTGTVAHLGRHGAESVRDCDCVTCRSTRATPIRSVDEAGIRRAVDKAFEPIRAQVAALEKRVDDARRTRDAEPLGCGWTRDADGTVRPRTTADVAAAANAAYGRDRDGKRPGEPGYRFDGVAMLKAGESINTVYAAFFGRKA